MRFAPLTFIKPDELTKLHEKIAFLETQVNVATDFVKEIEKGNWDATYDLAHNQSKGDNNNSLAESLLSLRTQLQTYSMQEKERNWVTEGLAKFIDILRSKNDDIHELTDSIIRNLVKYMGANQGALYLLNDDNTNDVYIEMTACYAYDRKKFMHQRIEVGEGLAGQVVLEKEYIYMTEVPNNYVRITSGLGDASPSNLLIMPLKIEENVFGVVEIASFTKIHTYQIEFVERLGESIASTLSTVKTNQRTQKLLHETQQQTEQMRSQEEEMRQNMEELSATQEEMQRVLKDVQDKEVYLNNLLNASNDSIMTIDLDNKLVMFNKNVSETFASQGVTIRKGLDVLSLFGPELKDKIKEVYQKVFRGETDVRIEESTSTTYEITTQPLKDVENFVVGALITKRDITQSIKQQRQTEKLLKEQTQRAEEMKAQEEVMTSMLVEVQEKERYLDELINVPKDSIFTVDKNYQILSYNKAFSSALEAMGLKQLKGYDLMELYPDATEKAKQKSYYDRAFKGENFENTIEYDTEGVKSYYTINYAPLHDSEGKIFAVASFAKDTTAIVSAQKQAEQYLFESKQQSEELRAQEEELRQNMEELSATQEEMHRILKEVQDKESYLNELINVPKDSIFTVDKNYQIISANKAMVSGIEAMMGITDLKGFDALSFYPDPQEREKQKGFYDRAFAGENFENTLEYDHAGVVSYYTINYAPLRDTSGTIVAVASFAKDTTAIVSAQKQAENLLAASSKAIKEMEDKERYLNELINVPNDSIFTVDKSFKVLSFNKAIANAMEASGVKLEKGTDLLAGLSEADREREIKNYKKAFKGESFEAINELTVPGGQKITFAINYAPLHDNDGKITSVAVFSKDVTAIHKK